MIDPAFSWTNDQQRALELLGGPARHTMLYGGSRSGKTFTLVAATVLRALKAPESRHAIFRHRFNHLKTSVGFDTLPKVMKLRFPEISYHINRTDWVVELPGGSEIWLAGLDDKERTEKILGQEYCLDPESKVLTADLRWVPARELEPGDAIVGFPEDLRGNQRLVRSIVERSEIIEAEKYRIITDRGETVVSAQHKFVFGKPQTRNRLKWVEAQKLKQGDWVKFATAPWGTLRDYDAGWLAGIYDGEGCVTKTGSYAHCQVAQKSGVVLSAIEDGLQKIGVATSRSPQSGSGVVNLHAAGMWQGMRLLGSIRPKRLLPKAHLLWEGRRAFNTRGDHHYARVLAIEPVGRGPVVSLGTSSKTLIADGFLGHNCTLYFNECSQIAYSAVLMARTRLAQRTALVNRAYYDCNPPGSKHWTAMVFVGAKDPASKPAGAPLPAPENYKAMVMNPGGNIQNLGEDYIKELENLPERQRNRFLLGKFTADLDNALWSIDSFRARVPGDQDERVRLAETCTRVVVAVDPSGASGPEDKRSDEIGIIVAGYRSSDKKYFVLEDATLRGSPTQWARRAIHLYKTYKADAVIAEKNFGGAMVQHTIKTEDSNVPVKEVTAARGKAVRAEPISALYAKGEVEHCEGLGELEDQMCVEMGTLIETRRGLVPIEQVTTSDWVMTRLGFAPVKWAGYTGETSQFVEIQAGSSKVRVTRCHPIFLPKKQQFAHAQHVQPLDHLLVSRNWASMVGQWRGVASGGTECHRATTGTQEASCFIGRSIKRTWAEFRKAMMCTTSMATRPITFRTTFAHLAAQSITQSTDALGSMFHRTLSSSGPVSSAGPERKRGELISQTDSAQIGALSVPAASARLIELDTLAPVYNISVADGHLPEFFANGILTHNCNMTSAGYMGERSPDRVDSLVWALSDLSQGKTIQVFGVI